MVVLTVLCFYQNGQLDLFNTNYNRGKELEPLMRAFDTINTRYGRGTVKLACGLKKTSNEKAASLPWEMKRDFLSPRYTTNIREIPAAY
jgi:DNA polymerase V